MDTKIILPPAKIGILGGGQLGMMFALSAKRMGYNVLVLDPNIHSLAGKVAHEHICVGFDSQDAIEKMKICSAITIDSENIPENLLQNLAKYTKIIPKPDNIKIIQNRILEKNWINKSGLKTTSYCVINNFNDIENYCKQFIPGILKTATLGYDGKGQEIVNNFDDLKAAFKNLGNVPCILEKFLKIDKEISVIISRLDNINYSIYPVIENIHKNGILDYSKVPANIDYHLEQQAKSMALQLSNSLDYIGVLAVEMFIVDNILYINELAPRPHNSGHFSIDACQVSQFDQQVRLLCGLKPIGIQLLSNCCMSNLLGDIWLNKSNNPNWIYILQEKNVKLYLYNKEKIVLGRKMGHFVVLDKNINDCFRLATKIRENLENLC